MNGSTNELCPHTIEMYDRTYAHDGRVYESMKAALRDSLERMTDHVILMRIDTHCFVNYYASREDV